MTSICLNMIVKNEGEIIQQTLENICHFIKIDSWVICDTGSTDDTVEKIENFFENKNIKGEIFYEPWKDFSYNRNIALKHCAGKSDYILIFDADDFFEGSFTLPAKLDKDCYLMNISSENRSLHYQRKLLLKNNQKFYWRGVLHEFIDQHGEISVGSINGEYQIISGRKGNRSKQNDKYLRDAEVLSKAFYEDNDENLKPRYAFYCAQSHRDAEQLDHAIHWYAKRAEMKEGWKDEIYTSYEQMGLLYERKKMDMQALYAWQCGVSTDPERAECWYHLARLNNWRGNYHLAYCYAKEVVKFKIPSGNRLFVNLPVYQYWCDYELCLNAYKLKDYINSYAAYKKLIENCPDDLINRLLHQLEHYKDMLNIESLENIFKIYQRLKKVNEEKILTDILNVKFDFET